MPGKLTINDNAIDLKPDTVIALTFAVSDVASVEDRQGSSSNSFHIPKTQGNILNLGYADKVNSGALQPYQKLDAQYVQNGIQVLKQAYAVLSEVGQDFEVTLYDGNTAFFTLIADKRLQDLDCSDLDHVWNLANVTGFISNTEGVIYPIVDYGNAPLSFVPGVRYIEVGFLLPWVFLHTLIERIFDAVGWTLSGAFTDSDLYNNLLVSLPTLKQDATKMQGNASVTVAHTYPTTDLSQVVPLQFNNIISDPLEAFITDGVLQNLTGFYGPFTQYNVLNPGSFSFTAVVDYTVHDTVSTYIQIAILGSPETSFLAQSEEILSGGGATNSDVVTLNVKDYPLETGMKICVRIVAGQSGANSGTFEINTASTFSCDTAVSTTFYHSWMPIAQNLPDITQKDLIKALMQMYCIIPISNAFTKNVQFVQFAEIMANKTLAIDWTDKMDMGTEPVISFRASSYAQTNWMRYKNDEGVTQNLGDGSFTVADEVLDTKKDLLTLPFAATEMITRLGDLDVPQYLRYDVTNLVWNDSTPRILILDRQVLSGLELTYTDPFGGVPNVGNENLCYFALDGKADNLKFSDNLLNRQYTDFIAMLNSFKKISCSMRLSAVDIEKLDFSIPIYLKQYSTYFFLNTISQWRDASTPCLVEFIKLP